MGTLDGRVALVTGAGQGSGSGVALALAAAGASVAVVGRTGSKLRDIALAISARGGQAEPVECDISRPEQIDSAVQIVVERFGTIDVLVNAADHNSRSGQLLEVDDVDIELLWSTGPRATLRFMRQCHRWLRGGGSVVNFGSATQFAPERYGVYAAMKEAITSLTRAAAVEWGPDGIRVNAVAPLVRSPTMDAGHEDPAAANQRLTERVPLRRVGDAEPDLGPVVTFLASDAAGYVTGQLFCVDGGLAYHR